MKSDSHDKQMVEVYGHIYDHFYNFETGAMERASAIIGKNLSELGITTESLPSLCVLNIGTGRESLVFHQLGAGEIFHFDVSNRSVQNLQNLSQKDGFRNIHSKQSDVCEASALCLDHVVDLVYLNGVLHHLHATGIAVKNIANSLRPFARIFFRIYRSGSLGFFVVDFIRRLINYEDFQLTSRMAAERFGNTADPAGIYADVIDDFFVPVLKLFDPRQVDDFFLRNGFQVIMPRRFLEYDHADTGTGGQGWSLYYEYMGGGTSQMPTGDFPGHIDQLHGIDYSEFFIKKTVNMMDAILERVGQMTTSSRIELALRLYEASQTYRRESHATGHENHERLQEILGGVSNGAA